jgi:hypothetical protein
MTGRDLDQRRGRTALFAGFAVFLAAAGVGHAANAATAAEYEKRIAALETRIDRLESMVDRLTANAAPVAATSAPGEEKPAVDPRPGNAGEKAAPAAVAAAGDPAAPDVQASEEDKNALNQLYVVRDAAVTLKPGRWEAGLEFNYTREDAFLQSSWALGAVSTLRYGAGDGLEFGLRLPYDWTHRRTETGTPNGAEVDLASLGDISLDVSKLVWHEGPVMPGVVVSGSVTLPTGVDPYSPSFRTPGKSPSNPFTFYRNASGHYSVDVGAQFFKTVDPFAYFGGVSFSYPFDRTINGIDIFPGYTIAYNLGATLALSDATSLGFAVLGAVHTDMVTGGRKVPNSSTMPVSASISILQRLANDFYVEPSITTGLTSDAPDALLALKTTKIF